MPSDKYFKSEIKEVLFYVFITVFLSLVIPLFIGLSLRGFEESFVSGKAFEFGTYLANYMTYYAFILISLLLILYPISRLISLKRGEHPATTKNPSWWRIFTVSYIYAPEENGLLWYLSEKLGFKGDKNFMKWSLNPLRVFIVAMLIFGIYGILLVANPQIAVSGVPQLQLQQVTLVSEVAFTSFVPGVSENGMLLFVFCSLMGINAYLCSRLKLGKEGFFLIGFLICILMGFLWGSYHIIAYGNDDAKFFSTVFFGFAGCLITMLTGIFIFWLVWHIINNAFIILIKAINIREDLFFVTIVTWVILFLLWIGIELYLKSKRKKSSDLSIPGN